MQKQIEIPEIILQAFRKKATYYVTYGGRAGAKSESIGRILLIEAQKKKHTIMCCREFQASIKDSVHSLLKYIIALYDMKGFTITETEIKHENGSRFIFRGLKKESVGSIKSIPNISIAWLEEAQYISRESLDILIPTIRNENSIVIFSLNPETELDPVYNDFVLTERNDTVKCFINYLDNPFVTKKTINDAEYDKKNDIEKYNHIWLGQTKKVSDAVIFKNRYIVESFETPKDAVFYYGADFGDVDPNTLIKMFIKDKILYIDSEMYEVNQKLEDMKDAYLKILGNDREVIRGDNARPETIKYLQRQGINIVGENKLQINDGIAYLKNFQKIVIHQRCKNTAYEVSVYSKVSDRQTGLITEKIIDKNNHCIDAIRYGLKPLIEQSRPKKGVSQYSITV